jgi:hypothetical protein
MTCRGIVMTERFAADATSVARFAIDDDARKSSVTVSATPLGSRSASVAIGTRRLRTFLEPGRSARSQEFARTAS